MGLQFGVFDHIEPIPGQELDQIYRDRLSQVDMFDAAGFYAYHLAEHHTPAVHSLAPSQNVFLAAAARTTHQIKLCPCIYVLPLHHPLRLIEEICMLDHLSDGRLEVGVGRGGVLEAYFWGSDWDTERNFAKYQETLEIIRLGLSHDSLTYNGEFYQFDDLPMRLRPKQKPYPPLWYMRNVEISAMEGMNSVIVGNLDSFEPNVARFQDLWRQHQGTGTKTLQGTEPKIGLVTHMVIADTEAEAVEAARPAWDEYLWNLTTPRRLEAERRGLTQFAGGAMNARPAGLPDREADMRYQTATATLAPERRQRREEPGQVAEQAKSASFRVIAGTPDTIRGYMDEYVSTGANYFVCAFHFGNMPEHIAERSIDLFIKDVMPHYV
ncbi:LLM class flavin-dependent oxidoreductase [Candidatus Entotheonella serta]|nr:LLM class flavin-dependent oxidoreductase [Candidatus Entotheonella serta]